MQEVVVASWPRHARRDLSPDSINLYSRERTMKSRSPLKAVLLIFAVLAGVGFAADTASAQATGTIRGRVLDAATLRPISGAQVVVRGTLLGAVTNNDGHYVISGVALGEQTVGVQMLGYQTADRTVTVTADGDVTVNFELSHQVFMLDEVVVTGTAGATQRRALGNTVSKVEAATITEITPISNVTQLLQGRTPGLTIMASSGQVGTASNFRIRGAGSLNANNHPVFYIDGVRVTSDSQGGYGTSSNTTRETSALDALNPEDIESIEVIKGPAAATLYGADAAAGVIQIITKKGRVGQQAVQWNARLDYGQSDWAVWMPTNYTLCTEARINNPSTWPGCEGMDPNADWRDRLLTDQPLKHPGVMRDGKNNRMSLSVRGGGDRYSYYVSGDRERQDGIFPNNYFERISGRANFMVKPADNLDMTVSLQYATTDTRQPENDNASNGWLRNAFRGIPGLNSPWAPGWRGLGPEQIKSYNNVTESDRFILGLTANYQPFSWFRNRLTLGMDAGERTNTLFYGIDRTGRQPFGETYSKGYVAHYRPQTRDYTIDYVGSIMSTLSDNVSSTTSFGMQYIARNLWSTETVGEGLVADKIRLIDTAAQTRAYESRTERRSLGFLLEEQIAWRDRLFVTAGVRMDDHSAFGANFERIYYPKASLSYVISDEDFFDFSFVDNLKLRAAWGRAGNAPAPFSADRTYGAAAVVMDNGSVVSSLDPDAFGNQDIRAEKGEEIEVGFDASFLDNNLGLEVTYYSSRTKDALISVPVPASSGWVGTVLRNIGEIANSGLEVAIFGSPIRTPSLTWDATLTLSTNSNEVISLGEGARDTIPVGYRNSQRHVAGYPLAGYWTQVPVRNADGSLVFDADGLVVYEDNMKYIGPSAPTREASLTNTFTLLDGNLQFYVFMDYKGGHYLFNMARQTAHLDGVSYEAALYNAGLLDEEEWILLTESQNYNEPFFEKADFVKLREVSVRYTLPESWARAARAKSMSVTLAGRNLAVWTDYSGSDPEVNIGGSATFTRADYMSVPMMRNFSASLNFTF